MSTDKYLEEFPEIEGEDLGQEAWKENSSTPILDEPQPNYLITLWENLAQAGLGDVAFRTGTQLLSIALILAAIWGMRAFYLHVHENTNLNKDAALAAELPVEPSSDELSIADISLPPLDALSFSFGAGIPRDSQLHTTIPTRPRTEVITYTVQKGDTIFGISENFNLKPETILWGNYWTLVDDPHRLQPDMVLNILPVDGVYHKWSAGEGLNGVADGYDVTPEDIINYPGNHLNSETLGDRRNPNIEPGTLLVIPGGERAFVTWSAPLGLTRENPAVARNLGPGFCGTVMDGAVGIGAFVWPADLHKVTGYDWSPATNHLGVDIGGGMGVPIYAADNGVAVYSGWNNHGYGYMVVLDHGNGWQTLYAHLSAIYVNCGQSIYQGAALGAMGSTGNSTGPHLHFEMMNTSYGKVNPNDFLP